MCVDEKKRRGYKERKRETESAGVFGQNKGEQEGGGTAHEDLRYLFLHLSLSFHETSPSLQWKLSKSKRERQKEGGQRGK